MADSNFNPKYDLLPTAEAQSKSLITAYGITLAGDVRAYGGSLSVEAEGKISSPTGEININRLVEHTTPGHQQIINASTSLTQINLELGNDIILNQSASTILQIIPPKTGARMFGIDRVHANNTNVYSLEFLANQTNYNWYKEGGLNLTLTQTANSVDYIVGFIDYLGRTVTFMPRLNWSTPRPFAESIPFYIPNNSVTISPRVEGVVAGTIFSTMVNETMNATNIIYDGKYTFTSPLHTKNLLAKKRNIKQIQRVSEPDFTIDLESESMIILDHSSDINSVILNVSDPDEFNTCVIYRVKDASSTPRLFTVDPTLLQYEVKPIFAQSASCFDVIFIQSIAGMNFISVFNDFF